MEEELQSLLTRIHKEGVERAESMAAEIVADAETRAKQIVAEAERRAATTVADAEQESLSLTERSKSALDHLARDFLIGVQNSLESLLLANVQGTVGEALTPDTMARMVATLTEAYAAAGMREGRIEVLLSPDQQEEFTRLALNGYRDRLGKGVEITPDGSIRRGFKIAFPGEKLYHDFTEEAISASLVPLLRPPLREIVQKAAESRE